MRNRLHVGNDGSCDVWHPQQRVDELPTHGRSVGRVGSSVATIDGYLSTSRTRNRVITEPGQRHLKTLNWTRIDATVSRLRLKDGERLYPKSWSGGTSLGGFAREVAAWLGYVDPKHEAGNLIQRITKGTLGATEPWTGARHAEDDTYVELDYELTVTLANVTEGAARSTVLKVTQVEPSHGFVAWQALVDGYAPKSANDPVVALRPTLATPQRCKDAKELKERLTALVIESGRVRASIQSD